MTQNNISACICVENYIKFSIAARLIKPLIPGVGSSNLGKPMGNPWEIMKTEIFIDEFTSRDSHFGLINARYLSLHEH